MTKFDVSGMQLMLAKRFDQKAGMAVQAANTKMRTDPGRGVMYAEGSIDGGQLTIGQAQDEPALRAVEDYRTAILRQCRR
jgi:hypothetical protein